METKKQFIKKITTEKKQVNYGSPKASLMAYEIDYSHCQQLIDFGGSIYRKANPKDMIDAYSKRDWDCQWRAMPSLQKKWGNAIIELDGIFCAACDDSDDEEMSDCCNAPIEDGYCSECGYSDDGRHN